MTATENIIETAYEPYTLDNEHTLSIAAEFDPGNDADRNEYGQPTECATEDEFEIVEIHVDGILYDGAFDDVFASQFWRYCRVRKTHVRHTWETLQTEIENELSSELWK